MPDWVWIIERTVSEKMSAFDALAAMNLDLTRSGNACCKDNDDVCMSVLPRVGVGSNKVMVGTVY